jgi:hypothetical protein
LTGDGLSAGAARAGSRSGALSRPGVSKPAHQRADQVKSWKKGAADAAAAERDAG